MQNKLTCAAAILMLTLSTAANAWGGQNRNQWQDRQVGHCNGFEDWQATRSMGIGAHDWLPCFVI